MVWGTAHSTYAQTVIRRLLAVDHTVQAEVLDDGIFVRAVTSYPACHFDDILLVSRPYDDSGWGVDEIATFRVRRESLCSASPVLAAMIHESFDDSEDKSGGIHRMHLDEDREVIAVLLGALHADESDKVIPLASLECPRLISVWKAAQKYELHMLTAWAADILTAKMPALSPKDVADLHKRATQSGHAGMAEKAKLELCKMPISTLPRETLVSMSPNLIMDVSRTREQHLADAFEALILQTFEHLHGGSILKDFVVLFPDRRALVEKETERYDVSGLSTGWTTCGDGCLHCQG